MITMQLRPAGFPKEDLSKRLTEENIHINRHAEAYFAHPGFSTEQPEALSIAIASLTELGFEDGATLEEIADAIPGKGLAPCPVNAGLFLRLAWKDQDRSRNSILSGTHSAPDGAVTVFSEILEKDDSFPKGLYLRNVDGELWLRGYACDAEYRFPGGALFAFVRESS